MDALKSQDSLHAWPLQMCPAPCLPDSQRFRNTITYSSSNVSCVSGPLTFSC